MSCRTDREIGRKSYLLCLVLYTKSSTTSFTYFSLLYPSIYPSIHIFIRTLYNKHKTNNQQQYTYPTSTMELFPFTTHHEPPYIFSSFSSFSSSFFSSLTTTTTTKIMNNNNNNNNNPTAISSLFLTFSIMSLFVSLFFWWIIFQVNWSFLFSFPFPLIYKRKRKREGEKEKEGEKEGKERCPC